MMLLYIVIKNWKLLQDYTTRKLVLMLIDRWADYAGMMRDCYFWLSFVGLVNDCMPEW